MKSIITPTKLQGTIKAIPSKSHAHRVLIAQKLAQLQGQEKANPLAIPSFSKDIEATKSCLAELDLDNPRLNCGESGSTIRFMIPVTMALKPQATFIGSGKLPLRPLSPLKEEMESHGSNFAMTGNTGDDVEICTVNGKLTAGTYRLAGNVSSQFITGLLFALPLLDGDSKLELTTKLESAGYVDLTLDVLRSFGINITQSQSAGGFITYNISGNQKYLEPDGLTIQGDWSNASFWLACGALGDGITCTGLDMNSSQRDKEFVDVLISMGADVTITRESDGTDSVKVSRGHGLHSETVSVAQTPDMVPVLAAVMATASGTSHIVDAERLKIKESDRLQTVYDFLSKLGADITVGDSDLTINGHSSLTGGCVSSHNDHRIAMAAAIAACSCDETVTICDAQAVSKSYPNFYEDYNSLGGNATKE